MLQLYSNCGIKMTQINRQTQTTDGESEDIQITYIYIAATIKTGEIEIEAETADEARKGTAKL